MNKSPIYRLSTLWSIRPIPIHLGKELTKKIRNGAYNYARLKPKINNKISLSKKEKGKLKNKKESN